MSTKRHRLWSTLAYAPVLVLAYCNFLYTRNHFYSRPPFLLDAGWFSTLVYRNGWLPESPPVLRWDIKYFWGWHLSPLLSLGSLLSYAFPGDRIDWYCLFQGAIYAPLGLAIPMLVPKHELGTARGALSVAAFGMAFCCCGQILACAGYPHFEIFAPAGIVVMLAGVATGRERAAWIGLVMAIATREDGGLHAGTFLVAALASDFLGQPFPLARRRLAIMTGVAFGMTALGLSIQKAFFVTPDAFTHELVGHPAFAHLTSAVVWGRVVRFVRECGFVWGPFVGTILVAVVRRDARYMLGWVVTIPWFLLNFTAIQVLKSHFSIYTGFPFIGSLFWVAAYAIGAERRPWRRALLPTSILSVLSFLGLYAGYPRVMPGVITDGIVPGARNPAGLRAFARELRTRREGRVVRMDPAMASWAIEAVRVGEGIGPEELRGGLVSGDAYAFFATADSLGTYVASPFPDCGRVPDTMVFYCTRPGAPHPAVVVPAAPMLAAVGLLGSHSRRVGDAIAVEAAPAEVAVFGPFVKVARGTYSATWRVSYGACDRAILSPEIRVDVWRGGLGPHPSLVIGHNGRVGEVDIRLDFDWDEASVDESIELRAFAGKCAYVIESIDLRRIDAEGQRL